VPGVELGLQAIALGQQRNVLRCQLGHDGGEAFPERRAADARAGKDFVLDEALQFGGHLQAVDGGAGGHVDLSWVRMQ